MTPQSVPTSRQNKQIATQSWNMLDTILQYPTSGYWYIQGLNFGIFRVWFWYIQGLGLVYSGSGFGIFRVWFWYIQGLGFGAIYGVWLQNSDPEFTKIQTMILPKPDPEYTKTQTLNIPKFRP
jgi:hypothetical protein